MNQESKRQGEAESIFVRGIQGQERGGHFRACLASETDDDNQPLENAIWGFWHNPSKWFNPEFLTTPTPSSDSYNSAKSSNFQILILESLPLVVSLN